MNKLFTILFLLACSSVFAKLIKVSPDTSVFRYIGRFDLSNPSKPQFAHSGNQIEFQFKGPEILVGLSDISSGGSENKNYFNVIVNGKVVDVIACGQGLKYYPIKLAQIDSFNTIEIFKRTEASCAIAVFHGVKYEIGEIKKTKSKQRKIEWIGDSFMAGYGNVLAIAPPPNGNPSTGFHAENENGYEAFGAITSRKLKADYSSVVVSGHGVYRNFDLSQEGTLPKVYSLIFQEEGYTGKPYNFDFQPDLIVIKIGTNDFGAEMQKPPVMADSIRFVKAYLGFLDEVIQKNPNSKIVLTVGGGLTDYFPAGLKRLSRFRSWVKEVERKEESKYKIEIGFFEFQPMQPPYGEDWHPTIQAQQKFANEITPYLKQFMNW